MLRWQALMWRLWLPDCAEVFQQLLAAYSQSGRYYHTSTHIVALLRHCDRVNAHLENPNEVELPSGFMMRCIARYRNKMNGVAPNG